MYDYLLRYEDEAQAKIEAEALAAAMGVPHAEEWQRAHTIPDVKAWQPSQDTIETIPATETVPEHERVVHAYIPGWFVLVALEDLMQPLLDTPYLQFVLDREKANIGKPFVVKNNIGQVISDAAWAPMFAGSNYPLGGYILQ